MVERNTNTNTNTNTYTNTNPQRVIPEHYKHIILGRHLRSYVPNMETDDRILGISSYIKEYLIKHRTTPTEQIEIEGRIGRFIPHPKLDTLELGDFENGMVKEWITKVLENREMGILPSFSPPTSPFYIFENGVKKEHFMLVLEKLREESREGGSLREVGKIYYEDSIYEDKSRESRQVSPPGATTLITKRDKDIINVLNSSFDFRITSCLEEPQVPKSKTSIIPLVVTSKRRKIRYSFQARREPLVFDLTIAQDAYGSIKYEIEVELKADFIIKNPESIMKIVSWLVSNILSIGVIIRDYGKEYVERSYSNGYGFGKAGGKEVGVVNGYLGQVMAMRETPIRDNGLVEEEKLELDQTKNN